MTIHEKLAALAAELKATGFGSEITESLGRVGQVLADAIHALEGKADQSVDPDALDNKLADLVEAKIAPFLKQIGDMFGGKVTELEAAIEGLKQNLHGYTPPPLQPAPTAADATAAPQA